MAEQSVRQKKREDWVDIAKAVAIVSVVMGHVNYAFPTTAWCPTKHLLGSHMWSVATFFVIGGFFLKEELLQNPVAFIKRKFSTLYLSILKIYIPIVLLHNVLIHVGVYRVGAVYGGKEMVVYDAQKFATSVLQTIGLAGREPLMGAMWFACVLLLELCLLSVVSRGVKQITTKYYEETRMMVVLLLAMGSCMLTRVWDFTIPRGNNTLTVMWLSYVGMQLMRRKVKFDNGWVCVLGVLAVYSYAVLGSGVGLNRNQYDDVFSLTISSVGACYALCYCAKRCKGIVRKCLAAIGRESGYIMALHFTAYKPCIWVMKQCGLSVDMAELSPSAENPGVFALYVIGGVALPMGFMWVLRKFRDGVKQQIKTART